MTMKILVANLGSTSLKWRLFDFSNNQERMLHKHAQRSTPLSGGGLLELRAGRHRGHFGLAPECISGLVVLIVARHWVRIHRWTVVASATGSAALALSRPSSSAAAEGSTRSRIVM